MNNNENIARAWINAFNAKDLDALLALYGEDAIHFSPKLKLRMPETKGLIRGKAAMRTWWADSFERLPGLQYILQQLTTQDNRVFIEYLRIVPGEADLSVAEYLEIENNYIIRSRVYHG